MSVDSTVAVTANDLERRTPGLYTIILCCFFVSGLTGLVYQILWTRMIIKIIGSAPFAISIVLTVFMGGLGLGSYLTGRIIDQVREPLKLVAIYGLLEIGIGLYGLVLPLLLWLFRPVYAVLYNHLFQHFFTYHFLTFLGCLVLLLLPVTLMGATLPVLSRFFVTSLNRIGTHVGRLYGFNTIGAALGSLLCGFWLIQYCGITGALFSAVVGNILIGIVCLLAARRWSRRLLPTGTVNREKPLAPEIKEVMNQSRGPVWHALIIFAISGFCAMAYEVIWVKLLGLLVGPTTYSFTIVLVTFITGLALGSIFFGWLVDRVNRPTILLLSTQLLSALFALWVSQLIGDGQIFFSKLIQHFQDDFTRLICVQSSVLFVFMFLPTFCLGATFPLVGKIFTRSLQKTGRSIGYAYSVNTIGAVLGSFCAGFLFIPLAGKELSIRLITGFQIIATLIIWTILLIKAGKKRLALVPVATLAGSILFFALLQYPHWNRLMLARGKYHRFEQLKKHKIGWTKALFDGMEIYAKDNESELAYYADGIDGFTSVLKTKPDVFGQVHYSLLNSGKADASSQKADMAIQTITAHFPMLFHPHPETVLVLGFASGITAGEVLHYPIQRLDTVEINRQVVAASDFFRPWNNGVRTDHRSELIIQDGRAHLTLTDRKYDVIISEPSNPWMAGLATLFTAEFMNLAKDRLNAGGIFVQWIHSYQMNWSTFSMVGRTFSTVFPNGLLVSANSLNPLCGPDFLLIGFQNDSTLDLETARKNLPYAQKSTNMSLLNPELFFNLVVSEKLGALFGPGPINTDNHPYLEYEAPKLMHYMVSSKEIMQKIAASRWLSEPIGAVIEKNRTDLDHLIDWEVFRLAFRQHEAGSLDLSQATDSQRERYHQLLTNYCAITPIYDFSFIHDAQFRQDSIHAHLDGLNQLAEAATDKTEHFYYMGWVCNNNKLPYSAAHFFLKALTYKPADAKSNDALKKLCLSQDADILYHLLAKEVLQHPDNPSLYYQTGILSQRQGRMDAAGELFQKSASMAPEFILPLNELVFLAIEKGDYADAISIYQKMISIKPQQANLYYNVACLFSKRNMPQESLEWLKKAIAKGYDKWDLIKTDKDLENIRATQDYRKLIHQMDHNDSL